ncbi:hypothetical protein GCM10008995_15710 [Halobellus salinus]|uniref:Halo transducer protein n=1 Tax=Halobellus salinus TaxID=931585 RepID=A0A830ESX5_9EURY|nr:halo transducer protein [Halobellus salinus]GGJ06669.1 hypothetical protein GCM10008995_15710 [Halobellus salinus]SMP15042.1 hypothetical protein SAMN06265347_10576 [Halobellus salinus]
METAEPNGITTTDVIDAVDEPDPDVVRDALEPVTEGGIVTREAVEAAVSDTSKLLATAETRIELAGDARADAAEAAAPIADVPSVRRRLDASGERLSAVESFVPELRPGFVIPDGVRHRPGVVYDLAVEIRDVVATAQEAIEAADDLSFDAEQFELWATDPRRRYDAFEQDVELVRESVTDLDTAADALADADDPAVQWADATMRVEVLSLLVADLQAERRDLRAVAERTGDPIRDGLGAALDPAADRLEAVESVLAARAVPTWRDRFGPDIGALERGLAPLDPPVEWETVDRILEDHRPAVTGDGAR